MKHIHAQKGFTLIETIVAVGILTFGILGPLYLANQSIVGTREAASRLAATAFAQEGVEIVRNIIANTSADNEPASHAQWLNYVTAGGAMCQSRCIADVRNMAQTTPLVPLRNVLKSCAPGPCNAIDIYQDTVSGFFTQSIAALPVTWVKTPYTREITVTPPASYDLPAKVVVKVTWPKGSVTLQEEIYNWFLQLS